MRPSNESKSPLSGEFVDDWENRMRDSLRACAVLVVDDEPGMRNFLRRALEPMCAAVEVAESVERAENIRRRCHFDLFILDIRLPGVSGLDWMHDIRAQGCQCDVIFITAYADLDTAIAALRVGAADFILKPFRLEQITNAVKNCMYRRRIERENMFLHRQVSRSQPMVGFVGDSAGIAEVGQLIKRVSASNSTVLIEGETGTGKEVVARAIHDTSERRGPFVALNCGSIASELIESELFGHAKGAFTGATREREGLIHFAHDGTLFLDEISEMPLPMQANLLRVLEDKVVRPLGAERETPVNARIIAATNRHLADEVERKRFRQDLYYRLDVVTIRVPPLRERLEDIPALVDYFVTALSAELGVVAVSLNHREISRLQSYAWPGNVRELRNVIERFLLLGQLPHDVLRGDDHCPTADSTHGPYPIDLTLEEVEKRHILAVVEAVDGNKSEAAHRLGVSRKTLERRLHQWRSVLP